MSIPFRPSVKIVVSKNRWEEVEEIIFKDYVKIVSKNNQETKERTEDLLESPDYITISFGTYPELLERMEVFLKVSDNNEVIVYRHRRGEWRVWFEKWSNINGNPTVTKQGWM